MRTLATLLVAVALFCSAGAATLKNHPHWKSERLPDLYYEVLVRAIEQEASLQAKDGRFRRQLPEPGDDESSWRVIGMQFIYAPAFLYVTKHPANPLYLNEKTLGMALKAGDYLVTCIAENGEVVPYVNGKPTDPLDSHRFLYCWTEAFGLLKDHLDSSRLKAWQAALRRAGKDLVRDLQPRIDRPRYTSPFLGYSPNHFGLRATTIWRMGMILNEPDWVSLTTGPIQRFARTIQPGGYWEEHDGPTMSYDYLNSSVAALDWHYTSDPAAWSAMKASTDFHLHWCTPDGVDIYTVDQRNRNHFQPSASFGLMTFTHFPAGRRFARFKLLAALGEGHDPLGSIGLSSLGRIAQNLHYYTDGPEGPIPQEADFYRHQLDRPAVVEKRGPWVYSISALVSPQRPLSQFYLDRTGPISLWHADCGHIIAGGNSKGQPELATFSVKRSDGSWSYLPLDALLENSPDGDTLCVAHEGFALRLTISVEGPASTALNVSSERTGSRTSDQCFLNLPLIMRPGKTVSTGAGDAHTLSDQDLSLDTDATKGEISYGNWSVTLPEDSRLTWPVYTYSPYGPVRVPKDLNNAVAVMSVQLSGIEESKLVRFSVRSRK